MTTHLHSQHASSKQLFIKDISGSYQIAPDDSVIEAARAVVEQSVSPGKHLNRTDRVREYLWLKTAGLEHEVFAAIWLDCRHRVIEYSELFHGTLDGAAVYPREVVKAALHHNAARVIFTHNHPSGEPDPSLADRKITRRLQEALALIDVQVLDHFVVGGTKVVSFSQEGLI